MRKYGFRDWDSVLAAVGHGGLKEGQIINKMQEYYKKEHKAAITDEEILKRAAANEGMGNAASLGGSKEKDSHIRSRSGIVVKGIDDVAVRFSRCCAPVPGDEIVGFVTRGRGISIHRTDCINVLNLSELDRMRLLDAVWQTHEDEEGRYMAEIKIYATDMDRQVLAKAKEGIYPERSIASVPPDLQRRFFRRQGEDYRIANEVKACVEFREHNLLKDEYLRDCHLILCRNVLIYFTEEAKDIAYRKFYKSLTSGGLFLSGSSEQIMNFREIGFVRKNVVYYQKP